MKLALIRKQIKKAQAKLTLYIVLAVGLFSMNQINSGTLFSEGFFSFLEASEEASVNENIAANTTEVLVQETVEAEVCETREPIGSICIQTGKLNVRETPNGTILGTVSLGETHDYFEEENGWLKIAYKDGEGYVCGKYGDIYDVDGVLVKPAAKSNSQAAAKATAQTQPAAEATAQTQPAAEVAAQTEPVAEVPAQEEPVQEVSAPQQTVQEKSPYEMTKTELCQWVLLQIITPDMNEFDIVRAVNQYLCDHMSYDLNYYTTRDAILLGKGRCQGYANAFKSLMTTIGIPTDYIRGYTGDSTDSTHAWNRVYIGGTYYYVDVTWNDAVGDNRYLLLGEEEFNQGRTIIEYNPKSE